VEIAWRVGFVTGNEGAKLVFMTANNRKTAATYFGRQMRKERLARGWTLRDLADRTGIDFTTLSRIENGRRPPNEKTAKAMDAVFPEMKDWFLDFYEESKQWTPPGFRNWTEYEDKATTLRVWMPGIMHGLLQTEDYARALLETYPDATDEIVTTRLAARMARQQRILKRDEPPLLFFVVDELSLLREVGSPEIMAEQMRALIKIARLSHVTMQVLAAAAHPANASELIVTDEAAYAEHLVGGFVYTDQETVSSRLRLFTTIHSETYRASESLQMFERMAEAWTGGSLLIPTRTAAPASKQPPVTA
jgi:transcriptional regulator with XRE-family HTH domain